MITIVSHYYPPVQNAPANRMNHLVKALAAKYGSENIRVVTGRPNHPAGLLPPEYRWRWWKRRQGKWGEEILSLYEYATPNQGLFKKTLGYVTFACSTACYLLFRRIRSDDILFVTVPSNFPGYAVYFLSRIRRNLRYTLDVRDLWPQAIAGIGFLREGSWVYRLLLDLTNRMYRAADRLIGVSEGIVEELKRQADPEKISLIRNPVNLEYFKPLPSEDVNQFRQKVGGALADDSRVTFLYAGIHAAYIDLSNLIKALHRVRGETCSFAFYLIGEGEDKANLQAEAQALGLEKYVTFLPFMPRDELLKYINAVDVCFASLKNTPTLQYAIPTKILEFLALGKLTVAALSGPFAQQLKQAGVATIVEPGNPDALADQLLTLIRNRELSCNGLPPRAFIQQHFSLEIFNELMLAEVEAGMSRSKQSVRH